MPRSYRVSSVDPLPPALHGRAFTVAEAREAAVTQSRLDARDLARPGWGLRSTRSARTLDEHARDLAAVLPQGAAFSHLTAARLWRLPLPTRWALTEPVDVLSRGTPLRRAGVRGHRGLDLREVEVLRGLRVTCPVPTWTDLATVAGLSVEDLVIAGDAFATRDRGLLIRLAQAGGGSGGRGRRKLRAAAELVRSGSGSPMETRARLAFGHARLPEPELNATVYAEDGHFLARVDFLWREARVIVEYEGDQHRTDRQQWQNDIQRLRLLEGLGWRVIRITAADLSDPHRGDELMRILHDLVG
ncbi:endonuclease domain-containing protein [Pedococcus bigeumensis]|uniref:endonuclease domain-containing protein n=1 Tax=Pedococcus bigeumensis TaxID=433644 RepID=UPI00138745C6|nr:DUF559 domain-containing protein [Pedococcus bigeumensis]